MTAYRLSEFEAGRWENDSITPPPGLIVEEDFIDEEMERKLVEYIEQKGVWDASL